MDINITHTMNSNQFENRENLRRTAKEILNKHGASSESVEKIMDKTIFGTESRAYSNAQLSILAASSQISMSNSLKETLKYLKNNYSKKEIKKPVLGEIWDLFSHEELNNNTDIIDFEIDYNAENIFAA